MDDDCQSHDFFLGADFGREWARLAGVDLGRGRSGTVSVLTGGPASAASAAGAWDTAVRAAAPEEASLRCLAMMLIASTRTANAIAE
jgi:hypothetical protein